MGIGTLRRYYEDKDKEENLEQSLKTLEEPSQREEPSQKEELSQGETKTEKQPEEKGRKIKVKKEDFPRGLQ